MRLRRLELAIIGVTLAFAVFMGGFFTGRNWNAVNIMPVQTQSEGSSQADTSVVIPTAPTAVLEASDVPDTRELQQTMQASPDDRAEQGGEVSGTVPESAGSEQVPGLPRDDDGRININIASQAELTDLPGIGNVLATRIVEYRMLYGDFRRIEDLRNVSGIGEKRFEAIADKITVG